jgi:hypothetical protein
MRCNESKHVKPERGSGIRVTLQLQPEIQAQIEEFLRRLPPAPDRPPGEPLPEITPETIGGVFDDAVALAREAQAKNLPSVEALRGWAAHKGFLSIYEARAQVSEQLYGCLDEEAARKRLTRSIPREAPAAWFVAKFLAQGDGPEWLDDDDGWEHVADALLDYIGLDEVEELAAQALDGLLAEDPLRRLEANVTTYERDEPGMYRGHPLFAYEESVRALKAADRLPECETLLLGLIDALEAQVADKGGSLSPHFYEQLAIVRRKMGNDAGELEVLERYFGEPGALDSASLGKRLDRVKARLGR